MRKPETEQLVSFYPTTTLFVDDDIGYLKSINLFMSYQDTIIAKFFLNPVKAIQYLNEHHAKDKWLEKCLSVVLEDDLKRQLADIQLHIEKIHQRIYDPERFSDVSMVVMDFRMPAGTGKEFLTMIENMSIAKGILSGVMGYDEALDSFNRQNFDMFLNKMEPDVPNLLVKYMKQARVLYFSGISSLTIKRDPKLAYTLNNPDFQQQFKEVLEQNNIVEYYLLDDAGSYLLLDEHAKPTLLHFTDYQNRHFTLTNDISKYNIDFKKVKSFAQYKEETGEDPIWR